MTHIPYDTDLGTNLEAEMEWTGHQRFRYPDLYGENARMCEEIALLRKETRRLREMNAHLKEEINFLKRIIEVLAE